MADHSEYQKAAAAFPTPQFIEPAAMRDILVGKDDGNRKTVQVVDVRGSDFTGGKLPGAINVPTDEFKGDDARVDRLVEELKDKDMVVFHCGKSLQRGPFAAARFLSRLNTAAAGDGAKLPEVCVLQGGWEAWVKQFGEEAGLTEPVVGEGGEEAK